MQSTFGPKDMVSNQIVLLTHKMFTTFEAKVFHDKQVTPEMVCDAVDAIGFTCSLVSITEMKGEEQTALLKAKRVRKV
jgi:hypothetical protein